MLTNPNAYGSTSLLGALARRTWLALFALAISSCMGGADEDSTPSAAVGRVAQGLDSDADSMEDYWEITYFGNLAQTAAGDFDGDGLTNLEEHTYGFNPASADDAYDDADADRMPNVFEVRRGSNPTSAASIPTANYTVDVAGGGTHTNISAAVTAATVANGSHQIIAIAAGTYTGNSNLRGVTVTSSKPKILFLGLEGASKTIIDGGLSNYGWLLQNGAVISSLTFQKATVAIGIDSTTQRIRLVDLIVRDNPAPSFAGGVYLNSAANLKIIGSTFINNTGLSTSQQIWFGAGSGTLVNTAVIGSSGGTMVAKASGATMTTNYSFASGQALTGTGNLAGSTDPKIRSDAHLLWDSPFRAAGGTVTQSLVDIDGQARPSTSPDIGVDQFVDSDSDSVEDKWEIDEAGDLTTLTSRTQDADSDGLTNESEFALLLKPTVADTDGDGLSDGNEVNTYGTDPFVTDTDGDDMPDGWEASYGLSPTIANGLSDTDGDRYPDVWEYARSTDPTSAASVPTANYTVNAAGGGTHTTISAAVAAADVVNGAYQIISIAPGTYTGPANLRDVTVTSAKPKILFIGVEGAAKTIIDGELYNYGWLLQNSAVVSSLTFKRATVAVGIDSTTKEILLVDLVVRDNIGPSFGAGVHVTSAANVKIVGSTFIDNAGFSTAKQIWFGAGSGTLVNTAVIGSSGGTMVAKASGATMTTNYSFASGQTLIGTGNVAGSADPKIRRDARLLPDSPLRSAGGGVAQSRVDMDGETRPSSGPDIGVDQYEDGDVDGLPDAWEVENTGNTSAITGAGDEDSDGLDNADEYYVETDRLEPDTDGDLLDDELELELGTNPLVADNDELPADLNSDRVIDSIGVQLGHLPNQSDSDGDGVSNADELLVCTDPLRSDTDGDTVADDTDEFPHDPLMSVLPSDPEDVTAPVITLMSPWYAVEQ